MRKAISLMMVLVLGMALLGTSAYAVCPGPDHITPWRYNGDPTPAGDDHGFDPPFESPAGHVYTLAPSAISGYKGSVHRWFLDIIVIAIVDRNLECHEATNAHNSQQGQ
jgi:hypothetical protein